MWVVACKPTTAASRAGVAPNTVKELPGAPAKEAVIGRPVSANSCCQPRRTARSSFFSLPVARANAPAADYARRQGCYARRPTWPPARHDRGPLARQTMSRTASLPGGNHALCTLPGAQGFVRRAMRAGRVVMRAGRRYGSDGVQLQLECNFL